MATSKQPKKVATPVVGENSVRSGFKQNVSVGNIHSDPYPGVKTDGIKIRGTGAATKGVKARGPMA